MRRQRLASPIVARAGGWSLSRWPGRVDDVGDGLVTLFLCGDVMTGRGVDQVLSHPGDPGLREACAGFARPYFHLAERAKWPDLAADRLSWPRGDDLEVLDDVAPDVRVINLETSITRSGGFAPGKAIHYRTSPGNLPCVAAVGPDACALANNHVLDFGRRGLEDTLGALSGVQGPAPRSGLPAAAKVLEPAAQLCEVFAVAADDIGGCLAAAHCGQIEQLRRQVHRWVLAAVKRLPGLPGSRRCVSVSFVTLLPGPFSCRGRRKIRPAKSTSPVPDLIYWAWSGVSD
jgi:Bacterial capsule synthesis protein PGA_cap